MTAKIPQPKDPLSISDNNDLNILLRPVPQHFKNLAPWRCQEEKKYISQLQHNLEVAIKVEI